MANTIANSQKFSSLEIVDSAKFDNEIVFDVLSMVGGSISMVTEEDITLSSTNTTEPGGINIMSGLDINIMCTFDSSTIWLIGGMNDDIIQVSGSISLGYGTNDTPFSTLKIEFDGTSPKIGFFNKEPVVQQNTDIESSTYVSNPGVNITTLDTFDGYTIGQIVKALRNYNLLN